MDSGRRLKTQPGFVQGVLELKEQLDLDFVPEPLVSSLHPTIDKGFRICTELNPGSFQKRTLTTLEQECITTLLSFYLTGKFTTAFDGEVAALQVTLSQLHCHLNSFTRTVVFCDSKTAIFGVNSNSPPASSNILDSKKLLKSMSEYSKQIILQWILGHCGVTGNEFANHLAKKGASIQQITRKAVPFICAKRIIK
ncbi:uncharacterized protein LOC103524116 [Trichonephila clavipes]|uniref:Uncharacterized protein LOC103524116 n=1 Tax=Trichonephila clavipes TaxID=2585209 RepID=A0A8X6WFY2_TRICX|nr:uncharacterized protein LOC103524116 [Trichonephila clavipes]